MILISIWFDNDLRFFFSFIYTYNLKVLSFCAVLYFLHIPFLCFKNVSVLYFSGPVPLFCLQVLVFYRLPDPSYL